jgi:hypothetical protein
MIIIGNDACFSLIFHTFSSSFYIHHFGWFFLFFFGFYLIFVVAMKGDCYYVGDFFFHSVPPFPIKASKEFMESEMRSWKYLIAEQFLTAYMAFDEFLSLKVYFYMLSFYVVQRCF